MILVVVGLAITSVVMKTIDIGTFHRGQTDTPLGLTLGLFLLLTLAGRPVPPSDSGSEER